MHKRVFSGQPMGARQGCEQLSGLIPMEPCLLKSDVRLTLSARALACTLITGGFVVGAPSAVCAARVRMCPEGLNPSTLHLALHPDAPRI